MTVLTFLGIVDISDSDDFGTINLKLALDLHDAIRTHSSELMIEEKAENIIEICCEQMLDNLIEFYDWHPGEIEYANFVFSLISISSSMVICSKSILERCLFISSKSINISTG